MIIWSDEFKLNIPHIDQEHQSLFDALNRFYEGLKQKAPKESLNSLIVELIDYAKNHFANEENYMMASGFKNIDNHIKEHRAFVEKAEEFYQKISEGKLLISVEVTNFIKDWITHHIKTEDMQFAITKN